MLWRTSPRIAIYSQDGLGLGHLRRNSLIGQHLLDQAPGSAILLFADSPVAPFFRLAEGIDHVKLPSVLKINAGQWRPTRLPVGAADVRRMREGLLRQAFVDFQPDLLLVDHMPHGAQGELIQPLKALKQSRPECRIVLGLRDILDRQEVVRRVWQNEGAYDVLRRYFDGILIYGSREIFDTARTYRLPELPQGTHYCGYIANTGAIQPASRIRERVRAPGRKLVFVSAGGGHDGHLLMRTYIRAIRLLGRRADFATLMALGVNAPPDICRELDVEVYGLPVQLVAFVNDSVSYIAAADLVVCMAGYNTLSEVLHHRKKALIVPRSGPSGEQKLRAGLFVEQGLIDVLYPEELTPARLAQRLLDDLERDDYPAHDAVIDTHGGRQAAAHLLEIVRTNAYALA